jgi:epsilon-lactone hydrolase
MNPPAAAPPPPRARWGDQIRAFAARATEAGVDVRLSIYDDMVHVWHLMRGATPAAQRAIDEIGAFARSHAR